MYTRNALTAIVALVIGLTAAAAAPAQESIDSIMEKARAQAQETEKLKKILNEEPDQNVRLAAFGLMVENGDPTMHAVAVEAGLASADSLLQAAAFREAIMSLDRIHLVLTVDSGASQEIQEKSKAYLAKNGDALVLDLAKKDRKAGTFSGRGGFKGEVTGTHLTYVWGRGSGVLELKDDDAVSGKVTVYSGGYLEFLATGKIR
jgi:hypothetical protein